MQSQRASTAANLSGLYDDDFFEWTRRNAELLRSGRVDQADIAHIAEEIEDMGKRDLKELNSRTQVLVAHLLKWQLQPEKAVRRAIAETGLTSDRFPGECPYTVEQILDPEFLP